jgi:uncharacterized pyridoxal phosphate-containing UPF0001 family protein
VSRSIKENVERIRDRVALSAKRVGRDPDSIIIMAATKTAEPEKIIESLSRSVLASQ